MTKERTVDVVVVGAGAAGCVVAARLAESGSRSILLLEAGPDRRADTPDDLRDGWHLGKTDDWGFRSEPDDRGESEDLRRCRIVGGTSWMTRFAVRGSPADFDDWAARGNPGWGFDDVLPAFNRLEADADFGDETWHGNAGPIPVRRYLDVEPTDIGLAALRALEAAGFPLVADHNQPGAVGAGRMPMSSSGGIRVTTADGYLPLGRTPPNLMIRSDAQVSDVVFEGDRTAGVRLMDGTVIRAARVVVCAGTYGSPPILLRSGIGPAEHLRSVGIPVRLDLRGVGGNLADHPGVDIAGDWHGTTRDAPLLHSIATFLSAAASPEGPPDLMLWIAEPAGDPPAFSIDAVLLKPRSRGSVRLRSAEPAAPPRITLPGLHDGADVDRLAEAYRRAREVVTRPEIRRLWTHPVPPEPGSASGLRRSIRDNAYSIPHVVGTCAMGPSPDDGAVVDAWGRVHGTEDLFVVDASIMPDVPSGFPHLSTIMIAERLSERIAAIP